MVDNDLYSEKRKNKAMFTTKRIMIILIPVLMYSAFSFVELSINPVDWGKGVRFVFVSFSAFLMRSYATCPFWDTKKD